jgi:nuclear transcription factor Y, gamma
MSTQPPFVQSGQPLPEFLKSFWERQIATAEQETPDYRHPPLPLARIKKVMKSDPDVKVTLKPFFWGLFGTDLFFFIYICR